MRRRFVFECDRGGTGHPTVDKAHRRARERLPEPSLDSVYRILDESAAVGFLKRMDNGRALHYHTAPGPHRHFACVRFGGRFNFHGADAGASVLAECAEAGVAAEAGIFVHGLCHGRHAAEADHGRPDEPGRHPPRRGDPMSVDKNSKTAKNLAHAFAGESQARNKYTYFAGVARKEGFEQIAALFEQTANNEKEHAKLWFAALDGIGDTAANLAAAAAGEHDEWTDMYKRFAEEAEAEGYADIARQFARVGAIEKRHEGRYLKLLEHVRRNEVWVRQGAAKWECRNCGHVFEGDRAPEMCPTCKHKQAFFEIEAENY